MKQGACNKACGMEILIFYCNTKQIMFFFGKSTTLEK